MEIWKDINDFPGYQVSNIGRVRSHNKVTFTERHGHRHWKDRILKTKVSKKDNYSRVDLWKDGKDYTLLVHRLEAVAFLGNPEAKEMTVNHKDGNRQNNLICNLEWLTLADNVRHAFETGLNHSQIPCVLIDLDGNKESFHSLSNASAFLERNPGYLSCVLGRGKTHATSKNGTKYSVLVVKQY